MRRRFSGLMSRWRMCCAWSSPTAMTREAATERREGCVSESAMEDWMQRRELAGLPREGWASEGRWVGGAFSKKEKGSDLVLGTRRVGGLVREGSGEMMVGLGLVLL